MNAFFGSMMDFDKASAPAGPDPIQIVPEETGAEKPEEPKAEPVKQAAPAPAKPAGVPLTPAPEKEDVTVKEENYGGYNPFQSSTMDLMKQMAKAQTPDIAEPTASMTDGFEIKGDKVEILIHADSAKVDSELHGDITCHDLYVGDAEVDGTIESDKTVILSDKARVKGSIYAKGIHVYGTFDGDLVSDEKLVIHKSANLSGTTKAFGTVEIHPGAVLNGTAAFTAPKEVPKEEPEKTEETVPDVKEEAVEEPVIHEAEDPFPEAETEEPAPAEEAEPEQETAEETVEDPAEPEAEPAPEEPSEEKPEDKPEDAEEKPEESSEDAPADENVDLPDSFFEAGV